MNGTHERSRTMGLGRVAVVTLTIVLAMLTCTAYGKEIEATAEESQIYNHTFDEAFQACQETIERQGWFIADKDKTKGTISVHVPPKGDFNRLDTVIQIHIQTVSTQPETRVTAHLHETARKRLGLGEKWLTDDANRNAHEFLANLQKVLATYR